MNNFFVRAGKIAVFMAAVSGSADFCQFEEHSNAGNVIISGPVQLQEQTSIPAAHRLVVCAKCKQQKLIDDFYKKGTRRDSCCKACVSKVKKTRYQKRKRSQNGARAHADLYSAKLTGEITATSLDAFGSVIAESIRGLMDEGKI